MQLQTYTRAATLMHQSQVIIIFVRCEYFVSANQHNRSVQQDIIINLLFEPEGRTARSIQKRQRTDVFSVVSKNLGQHKIYYKTYWNSNTIS